MQNNIQFDCLEEVIEELTNGILIVSEQRELIYANSCASRILRQLNHSKTQANSVPEEIWHICQSLISSRDLFPHQCWLIESEVVTDSSVAFHVQAQWLKGKAPANTYVLLTLTDQSQSIKVIVIEEAYKYGLTPRETEVWLLHRANYTYKEIAAELEITPNTVKKHMKSIHVKQKAFLEREQ